PKGEVKTSSAIAHLTMNEALSDIPMVKVKLAALDNLTLTDLFVTAQLAESKSEARRLIRGGGAYINETQLNPQNENNPANGLECITTGEITLRAGKKRYKKIVID
ncbi:MAG: hypothetical protein ACRCTY_04680, partial [Candidatus Adiutrix sp.]